MLATIAGPLPLSLHPYLLPQALSPTSSSHPSSRRPCYPPTLQVSATLTPILGYLPDPWEDVVCLGDAPWWHDSVCLDP